MPGQNFLEIRLKRDHLKDSRPRYTNLTMILKFHNFFFFFLIAYILFCNYLNLNTFFIIIYVLI